MTYFFKFRALRTFLIGTFLEAPFRGRVEHSAAAVMLNKHCFQQLIQGARVNVPPTFFFTFKTRPNMRACEIHLNRFPSFWFLILLYLFKIYVLRNLA